jgi:hypothetical protein
MDEMQEWQERRRLIEERRRLIEERKRVFEKQGVNTYYPEEYEHFFIGVDASFNVQTLYTVTKEDMVLHSKKVNIQPNEDDDDYWFRMKVYGDKIFFTDFNGMRVYNERLEVILQHDLSQKELDERDVYCFKYDRRTSKLKIWLASKICSVCERDKYHNVEGVNKKDVIVFEI